MERVSLKAPNPNPTYNITIGTVLTIGFGVTCCGYKPISMKNKNLHSLKLKAKAPESKTNPKRKPDRLPDPSIFRCKLAVG